MTKPKQVTKSTAKVAPVVPKTKTAKESGVLELSRKDIERIASVLKPLVVGGEVYHHQGPDAERRVSEVASDKDEPMPTKTASPVEQEQYHLSEELTEVLVKIEQLTKALTPILPDEIEAGNSKETSDNGLWNDSSVRIQQTTRQQRRDVRILDNKLQSLLNNIAI